jgi:hypothetical protein
MVVDQLMGQWDRFWKNLEAFGDTRGRLHFLARDNGGATLSDWVQHADYDRWVSRYDRSVIEKLEALHAFLSGHSPRFAGYSAVEKWKSDVGFISSDSFATFKKKLALLITKRVPALEKQYGARVYFATTPQAPAATPQ